MDNQPYKEYINKLEDLFLTFIKSDGELSYEGDRSSEGKPHGVGTMYYPENDSKEREKYVGEWKNGKRHGKGKLKWRTGGLYEGIWKNDLRSGKGVFSSQEGIYNGHWKGGERSGKGKFTWENGEEYEGEWLNDKMHGAGLYTYADGVCFEGEWLSGKLVKSSGNKIDGNDCIVIGTQIWMPKNLDVETFRNGDVIPQITSDEEWEKYGKLGEPAWCYYENKKFYGDSYGKLYNWYAVTDSRGLAPEGWIVPSDSDWKKLIDYLGGDSVAGNKLKSISGWENNENGNDESGFTALPGGIRYGLKVGEEGQGIFWYKGDEGRWWSTKESSSYEEDACAFLVNTCVIEEGLKACGYSVRCLKLAAKKK
jgi:uncharacterized protein (TIGR02145 family)